MKTTRQVIILAVYLCLSMRSVAQPASGLSITDVLATDEGAIMLTWQSESNVVYRVDYADQLNDPSLGYTDWQTLYDRYPSHGSNTFWLDTGNYFVENPIPHPKYATSRFYRIVSEGTNSGAAPTVTITAPVSGATLSGAITVSVAASTPYPVLTTKLYVDGEEMYPSDDGTNYTFNTCEWPNGPHVLFGTAEADSAIDGPNGAWPVGVGRAVSPYVPVTFSNLITKIAFSQQFFEPSLGQTQQVTASFAANVNWTLKILDENTNTVRTVAGSGGSMVVNWDGTGDGGVAIPDGLYTYAFSAQTNGLALSVDYKAGSSHANAPSTPDITGDRALLGETTASYPTSKKQAVAAGLGSYYVQPPPMPLVRTNGQWVVWEDVYGPIEPIRVDLRDSGPEEGLAPLGPDSSTLVAMVAAATSESPTPSGHPGISSQSVTAPTRPPTSPVKGKRGDYSICVSSNPNTNAWAVPT